MVSRSNAELRAGAERRRAVQLASLVSADTLACSVKLLQTLHALIEVLRQAELVRTETAPAVQRHFASGKLKTQLAAALASHRRAADTLKVVRRSSNDLLAAVRREEKVARQTVSRSRAGGRSRTASGRRR
jgi:hypothetical protein